MTSSRANKQTVQLIPNGVNPGTDFRMEFHMWMNYNGGALGGTGSTQAMVAGLNTQAGGTGLIGPSGAAPSITPLPGDGYAITANGEGGSANDYRMYDRGDPIDDGPNFPKVNGTWPGSSELRFDRTTGDLVLAAGNPVLDTPSNHANSYYDTVFPGDAIGGGQFETRAPRQGVGARGHRAARQRSHLLHERAAHLHALPPGRGGGCARVRLHRRVCQRRQPGHRQLHPLREHHRHAVCCRLAFHRVQRQLFQRRELERRRAQRRQRKG